MKNSISIICQVVAINLILSGNAHALPEWTANECVKPWQPHISYDNDHRDFHVYVESDFASELTTCTSVSDNQLNENMLRNEVMSAMEAWNGESRATALLYGGVHSSIQNMCNSSSTASEAIYVQFDKSCKPSWWPWACDSVNATAGPYPGTCASGLSMLITMWGSLESRNDTCANRPINWYLGDWSDAVANGGNDIAELRTTLIHEIGHTLGLAHPDQNSIIGVNGNTVMQSIGDQSPEPHLGPWDRDCVDDRWGRKLSDVRYLAIKENGTTLANARDLTNQYYRTSKGAIGNSYFRRFSSTHYMYPNVTNDVSTPVHSFSTVNSDGFLSFSDHPLHFTLLPTAFDAGVIAFERDRSNNVKTHRVNFLNANRDFPSNSKYRDSNTLWMSGLEGTYKVGTSSLRTLLPITTAWDPRSQETIFVRVHADNSFQTIFNPVSGTQVDNRIYVHAGYDGTYDKIHPGIVNNGSVPFDGLNPWNYQNRTYFVPSISCSDRATSSYSNCVVAWIDKGVPGGHVLYRYFKVIAPGSILWRSSVNVMSTGGAIGHVSGAFFGGRHYVAFKRSSDEIKVFSTPDTCYNCWSEETNISAKASNSTKSIVDAPSWGSSHVSGHERALFWTETMD